MSRDASRFALIDDSMFSSVFRLLNANTPNSEGLGLEMELSVTNNEKHAVALSGNGKVFAVAGSPFIQIYHLLESGWELQNTIPTPADIKENIFLSGSLRYQISLDEEGQTLVASASGSYAKLVFAYRLGVNAMVLQEFSSPRDDALAGYFSTLSDDGSTIAISQTSECSPVSGEVNVFLLLGNGPTLRLQKVGQSVEGNAVSLSSDGSILAVGTPNASSGANGSVQVYKLESGNWEAYGQELLGTGGFISSCEYFGIAIDLSASGNVIAIGAPANEGLPDRGSFQVYQMQEANWKQVSSVIGEGDEGAFGRFVDISASGLTVAASSVEGPVSIYSLDI
jgi:WD40 repeat protein